MSVATSIDHLADIVEPAISRVAAADPQRVEALELFVPYAKACVAEIDRNARALGGDWDDPGDRIAALRRGLRRLAAQFEVLRCAGAARLCRATEAAVAASTDFPGAFVITATIALEEYLEELAVDDGAEIHGVRELLAAMRGDGEAPVAMAPSGEFAGDQAEFLLAARAQLDRMRQALQGHAESCDLEPFATARSAARGIVGIGGLLGLAPLAEVAAAISSALLRAAPDAMYDAASVDRLLDGVEVLQQLLDGLEGGSMPSMEEVALLLDRCSAPLAVEPEEADSQEPEAVVAEVVEVVEHPVAEPRVAALPTRVQVVVVDSMHYGLDAERVDRLIHGADVARAGLPTIDLRAERLGVPATQLATCMVAVRADVTEGADRVGLLVDRAGEVLELAEEQFERHDGSCFVGSVRLESGILRVLDLERVLATPVAPPTAQ